MFQELTRSRRQDCVSDLQLDAWSADELDGEVAQGLQAHVLGCERCSARQHDIAHARDAFLAERPLFVAPRKQRKVALAWARSGAAITLLAAAALLLVRLKPEPDATSGTRIKGGEQVGFFVKHGDQVKQGHDGMTIAPGDSLRFVYSTASAHYLAILSRDPKQKASAYFPAGLEAVRVTPGQNVALPVSVELDDTVGAEEIFAIFCERTFLLRSYLDQLESRQTPLNPEPGCNVRTLHLVKK